MDEKTSPKEKTAYKRFLLIIDKRVLNRECFSRALSSYNRNIKIITLGSIQEWGEFQKQESYPDAVILNPETKDLSSQAAENEIKEIVSEFTPKPVIILKEKDNLLEILKALEYGAKGYIPSSVDLNICIEAIELAIAGGFFIPASSIFEIRELIEASPNHEKDNPLNDLFTTRERQIVEALSMGKPNKIIAYDLTLQESTVKIHIRNIMKKLQVTNRTEAVYRINRILNPTSTS